LCTNSLPCPVSSGDILLSSVREQSTSHNEQGTVNKPSSVSLGQQRNFSEEPQFMEVFLEIIQRQRLR
jgi:hypothetical protein